MQFERRCSASHQFVGASDRRHQREASASPPPLRAAALGVPLFALLALGLVALFFGANSPAEAQSSSGTLMCAPGWEMVGTRCKYLSFGIQVLWRDAIYCRAGTQPNPGHTRCVEIPEPDPPPSSGDDDDDEEDDDDDGSDDGPTSVTGGPLLVCGEGYTFNAASNQCEPDSLPLAAPSISDFRVPAGGVVDTVFPVATGGTPPYGYSLTGLPPGISFVSSTRRASGTLPTVSVDTIYTLTYGVTDSVGATASFTFSTTVLAAAQPPPSDPPPPPDPPTPTGPATRTLPFTVSETGASERTYRFSLSSRTEVSVSLTGMNRDIDCRVNSSLCSNRGSTLDDSWSGTLEAGTHTVTVFPYGGGSGSWTLSVSGTATSPPPGPPTPEPPPPPSGSGQIVKTGVNVSSSRTYVLRLSGRVEVSVELTGMTTDFDCTVSGNRCTNRGGTADDSWSGTLDAGDHKIVVYPYGGGSGNYTLTVSARMPSDGTTGTRTEVTTVVDTSETNVSSSRTYSFTLAGPARVDVALTGLTIDFDCRVGSSRCTNRWGTLDDSWSGDLAAGNHSVVVYPYDPGPGDYSLTVTATETVTFVAQPTGSTTVAICEEGEDGEADEDECEDIVINDEITVTEEDPGDGGTGGPGPGEGDPAPDPAPEPGPENGGTNTDVAPESLQNRMRDCGWNFDAGDRFDSPRGNRLHNAIDIQTHYGSEFKAAAAGTVHHGFQAGGCDYYVKVVHDAGTSEVHCHVVPDSRPAAGTSVVGGDVVGRYPASRAQELELAPGSSGPHHHFKFSGADGVALDPIENLFGGQEATEARGFTFEDTETCEAPTSPSSSD